MRKFFFLSLSLLLCLLSAPTIQRAQQADFDVRRYGAKCDNSTDDRAALNTANAAAAVNGGTLLIPGKCVVGSNLTISSNVRLRFAVNGQLKPSTGITVTINGDIEPIQQQIFAGAGAVSFSSNKKVPLFSPYWWGATGDGTTDDMAAWTATFAAIPDGSAVGYIPATANFRITSTLSLTDRTQVSVIAGDALPVSGYPRMTYDGSANGRLWDVLDCYQVTIQGFSFYSTVDIDRYIKTDRDNGFNSGNTFRYLNFNAGHQYNSSFIALSIDESGGENNENMTVEDCRFTVSGESATYRSDSGSISASSTTLTCSDCSFVSGDVGKTIRVGKAGAAGATLTTTIASRTSSTVVELSAAASTTATNARIHTGTGCGVAVYNGTNPNAKHQIFRNLSIRYADKGIHSKTGSFTAYNISNGFNNYGIYIEDTTEPVIIEQQVQEGNLVELYVGGTNAPIEIRNCRGSNGWQLTEGFYILDGKIAWRDSQVEELPPVGGKIVKRVGSGNLDLILDNTRFAITQTTVGVSLEDSGLKDLLTATERVAIRGNTNIRGLPADAKNYQSFSWNQYGILGSTGFNLPLATSVNVSGDISASLALNAKSSIDSVGIGDDEIEITGVFRPNTPALRVSGTTGSTRYDLCLVACDAAGNCSLRSSAATISTANSTLSSTNKITVYWAAVPSASTYKLYRVDPGNSGQGVLVASGLTGTSYDLTSNPSTSYVAWTTLTPAYNQATAIRVRARTIYVNEVAFSDGDTSPTVVRGSDFVTANTGATSITTFDDGVEGQLIRVRVADANTTFVNGSSLVTGTGSNISATNGYVYSFIYRNSAWRRVQ